MVLGSAADANKGCFEWLSSGDVQTGSMELLVWATDTGRGQDSERHLRVLCA